ncbi:hypothetical protein MKW98_007904 [Papaver atlanticum]|uniref:Small auxin-up RNA n=1 Tax=Papaver atlanticum TaxID=357466 RepID=A0AAD4SKW5_9MAGN|nr:hypothetical protein MKW98_007904 [Papaver atlanticum]
MLYEKISMQDEKKMNKVKKGWLAVQVGLEEEGGFQRFVIPISYLYHSLFKRLLDKAHEVYGYHTNGPLILPCSICDFLHLKARIDKEVNNQQYYQQNLRRHHHLATLSFH